ncbi:hypothetical protein FN846DRAFT_910121 [Sphaerosporella brunnea]|uniref:Uncharacterized protein n=1 Tax=Sphaerosporella brunnea TaxID=1250544 RepID=A0A5J5EP75_9PEZI|nr:hypothetical protein FN846DRAFT_910121 [Sphaerosporella brunnea]
MSRSICPPQPGKAKDSAEFGFVPPGRNKRKFHAELIEFIWARVLTVALHALSLSVWYRNVFAGFRVVAANNNLYRFRNVMWANGVRGHSIVGAKEPHPLPDDPVVEVPQDFDAQGGDDDPGAGLVRPDRQADVPRAGLDARSYGADHGADVPHAGLGAGFPRAGLGADVPRAGLGDRFPGADPGADVPRAGLGAGFARRGFGVPEDDDDAPGVGGAVTLRDYLALKAESEQAKQDRIDQMMMRLKTIVTDFNEQANIALCARLA